MSVKITIGCALAALLVLLMSGSRLSGQDAQAKQPQPTKKVLKTVPINYTRPDSGPEMFKSYCAACHGADGTGNGPAVVFLKTPPPNLRTMAQRNSGNFPADHVVSLLNFKSASHAHGTLEMPTWGPLFRSLDTNMANVRVHNLTNFIESIQEK